jgi:hypothetical protein
MMENYAISKPKNYPSDRRYLGILRELNSNKKTKQVKHGRQSSLCIQRDSGFGWEYCQGPDLKKEKLYLIILKRLK